MSNRTTFTSLHKPSKHVTGTGVAGYVECTFDHLVNLFGEPMIKTDGHKTSAEWHVEVRLNDVLQGVASVYDYKQHNTYTKDGTETQDITHWHVGGKMGIAGEVMAFIKHPQMLKQTGNVQ